VIVTLATVGRSGRKWEFEQFAHPQGRERNVPSTTRAVKGRLFEADSARLDQIVVALNNLPSWGHQEVLRRLIEVVARYERTGDTKVVDHFMESLRMTVRMERDPAYVMATAEREAQGEPRDIQDVIAQIEARDRGDGA
jgi:hypothetical protein